MAGPWFTVVENNSNWQTADSMLISDGRQHVRGEVQVKVELFDPNVEPNVEPDSLTPSIPRPSVQLTESGNSKLTKSN